MNTLARIIQSRGLTDVGEILTSFAVDVEVRSGSTTATLPELIEALTPDAISEGTKLLLSLSNQRIDVADPAVRALIEGEHGKTVDAEKSAALLKKGTTIVPQWEADGLDAMPSKDAVIEALAQIECVAWIESVAEPLIQKLKISGGNLADAKSQLAKALEG